MVLDFLIFLYQVLYVRRLWLDLVWVFSLAFVLHVIYPNYFADAPVDRHNANDSTIEDNGFIAIPCSGY
jgi:hypothetical protein